jgi:hypothetical protein
MTFRGFLAAATGALLLAALPSPGAAQWTSKQRAEFNTDCLDACRKNPKVPEQFQPQCVDYCSCVIEEGEKVLTSADYDEIGRDFAARNITPKVKTLQNLSGVCNRKAFAR